MASNPSSRAVTDASQQAGQVATLSKSSSEHGHVGTSSQSLDKLFSRADARIRQDIIRMVLQYLHEEGFTSTRVVLHDEANLKQKEYEQDSQDWRRLKKSVLDGDWPEVEKTITKCVAVKHQKAVLYAVYKQQYLEMIDNRDLQKAYSFLVKRLKPLEQYSTSAGGGAHHSGSASNEFVDLCYLLTVSHIGDSPAFKSWDGIVTSREQLLDELRSIIRLQNAIVADDGVSQVPDGRLVHLLKQAVAHQINICKYHPNAVPRVTSLLYDYETEVVPNSCLKWQLAHRNNVKTCEWVGEEGLHFVTGSSDCSLKLWDTQTGACLDMAREAHASKVWDCSSNRSGSVLGSVGGDGAVKLWDSRHAKLNPLATVEISSGDLYCVKFHQANGHLVTGGYDKQVRLVDANRGAVVQTFAGHGLSVSSCTFNPYGNLVVTGSKDHTIKFWDINSGLCVKTISSHLGEVTSVDINHTGAFLLSSSKDNSIRLWDIRMIRPIRRFNGHQNISKNFITASITNSLVVSGSEDGLVHIWDLETGETVQKLEGHEGTVYKALWNARQSKWISCSDDLTWRIWE